MTLNEDYVSFEIAKLLKEKGFSSDDCHTAYDKDGAFFWHGDYSKDRKGIVDAPTQSMAMKWLRDTFHLEIYLFHDAIQENNDWWYRIERHSKGYSLTEDESDVIYKTYEQAAEAAIMYCLENLI